MEKTMICAWCSALITSTVNRRDGSSEVMESFNVQFTDGLDTVLCETTKATTALIKAKPLVVGNAYPVRVKLVVVDYTNRDNQDQKFFTSKLTDIAL